MIKIIGRDTVPIPTKIPTFRNEQSISGEEMLGLFPFENTCCHCLHIEPYCLVSLAQLYVH